MASWWVPQLDAEPGRWPFTTLRKLALGGELVQMEIEPADLPDEWQGWTLVIRAQMDAKGRVVRQGLVLVDPDDGA
jgi:hypothetical protein